MRDGSCLFPKTWGRFAALSTVENHTPRAVGLPQGLRGRLAATVPSLTVAAFFASPLAAQDVAYIGPPGNAPERMTTVTLQPTEEPGAYAEVIYVNRDVNGSRDDGPYHVAIPGLTVEINFRWSSAADSIEVITPSGFYAVPAVVDVAEGSTATILIYAGEWLGG